MKHASHAMEAGCLNLRSTGVEQKGFGFIQPDEGGVDVFVQIFAGERRGCES
jgi:hypothetical protein